MPGIRIKEKLKIFSVRKKTDWYEYLLFKVFEPMTLGRLTVTLPDGQTRYFGRGEGGIKANARILNHNFFKRCVFYGDVGFGESYVEGEWETDNLTNVISWMILNVEHHPTLMSDREKRTPVNLLKIINQLYSVFRPNSVQGSKKNIMDHYDLGNEFFATFLDPTMTYSCAYYKFQDQSLEEAQKSKYEEFCRKLRLKSTDHVLEIGSGWGGFAIFAAKNFGCRITTITISPQQFEFARKRIQEEKLDSKIEIKLMDYRHLQGQFDKIVSIEMIEAVGHKYYNDFFAQCHRLLKEDGFLGLQSILSPDHRYDSFRKNVDWIQKHIFPGSLLPSYGVLHQAINATGALCLFNYEDITPFYVKTLVSWRENFNRKEDTIKAIGFDEKFIRKWNYYLSYCEAAFGMRNISVAQAIFTRPNNLLLNPSGR